VRVALDSTVLLYAQGMNDPERQLRAREVIAHLIQGDIVVPAQALGEVFAVLTRKFGETAENARAVLMRWHDGYEVAPTTDRVLLRAADLAADHRLNIWDAVIFVAAAEVGCAILLSEDMQNGFIWGGVQVLDPFRPEGWTRLQSLITGDPASKPSKNGAPA
jgi:predicted nucleic acid-binding protein